MLCIYTTIYFLGMVLYYMGLKFIASGIMIALAIFLCVTDIKRSKRIVNIRSLFALGFVGGFGLSLLKLSNLSRKYSVMTFLAVFVAYFSLYVGAFILEKNKKNNEKQKSLRTNKEIKVLNSQDTLLLIMFLVTALTFALEIFILGFLPFFEKATPHAYSTFHVFGLHYITTLYVFIPSIALCNFFVSDKKRIYTLVVLFSYLYVIVFAVLMVSRFQLITSIMLSVFVILTYKTKSLFEFFENRKYKKQGMSGADIFKIVFLVFAFALFVGLYIVITIYRSHNVEYLNKIFDMKNKNLPIFITQPYMYIAHNFENLNYMINNTFRWTFGRRILYPFFTLTFIKKFFPIVVDSPYYIIKEELSTVTLIYDFYYDFGLVGIIVFCYILGYEGKKIENKAYENIEINNLCKNNYILILFAQFAYYMLFSFFQTYFSLTDTWINIVFLVMIDLFMVMNIKTIPNQASEKQKDDYAKMIIESIFGKDFFVKKVKKKVNKNEKKTEKNIKEINNKKIEKINEDKDDLKNKNKKKKNVKEIENNLKGKKEDVDKADKVDKVDKVVNELDPITSILNSIRFNNFIVKKNKKVYEEEKNNEEIVNEEKAEKENKEKFDKKKKKKSIKNEVKEELIIENEEEEDDGGFAISDYNDMYEYALSNDIDAENEILEEKNVESNIVESNIEENNIEENNIEESEILNEEIGKNIIAEKEIEENSEDEKGNKAKKSNNKKRKKKKEAIEDEVIKENEEREKDNIEKENQEIKNDEIEKFEKEEIQLEDEKLKKELEDKDIVLDKELRIEQPIVNENMDEEPKKFAFGKFFKSLFDKLPKESNTQLASKNDFKLFENIDKKEMLTNDDKLLDNTNENGILDDGIIDIDELVNDDMVESENVNVDFLEDKNMNENIMESSIDEENLFKEVADNSLAKEDDKKIKEEIIEEEINGAIEIEEIKEENSKKGRKVKNSVIEEKQKTKKSRKLKKEDFLNKKDTVKNVKEKNEKQDIQNVIEVVKIKEDEKVKNDQIKKSSKESIKQVDLYDNEVSERQIQEVPLDILPQDKENDNKFVNVDVDTESFYHDLNFDEKIIDDSNNQELENENFEEISKNDSSVNIDLINSIVNDVAKNNSINGISSRKRENRKVNNKNVKNVFFEKFFGGVSKNKNEEKKVNNEKQNEKQEFLNENLPERNYAEAEFNEGKLDFENEDLNLGENKLDFEEDDLDLGENKLDFEENKLDDIKIETKVDAIKNDTENTKFKEKKNNVDIKKIETDKNEMKFTKSETKISMDEKELRKNKFVSNDNNFKQPMQSIEKVVTENKLNNSKVFEEEKVPEIKRVKKKSIFEVNKRSGVNKDFAMNVGINRSSFYGKKRIIENVNDIQNINKLEQHNLDDYNKQILPDEAMKKYGIEMFQKEEFVKQKDAIEQNEVIVRNDTIGQNSEINQKKIIEAKDITKNQEDTGNSEDTKDVSQNKPKENWLKKGILGLGLSQKNRKRIKNIFYDEEDDFDFAPPKKEKIKESEYETLLSNEYDDNDVDTMFQQIIDIDEEDI